MEKFATDLLSLHWWLSVVVVGISINIASAYLKPFMEDRIARVSDSVRRRRDLARAEWEEQVAALQKNSELRSIYALREIRYRLQTLTHLVFSSFFLYFFLWASAAGNSLVSLASGLLGSLAILSALGAFQDAKNVKRLIEVSMENLASFRP